AALSITVVPSANAAAINRFSVAPTLGKSSQIWEPFNRSASATTQPCSIVLLAPSCRRPFWCMSNGREPIASPPGNATTACFSLPTSGPNTPTDARSLLIAGESARWESSAGVVMYTVSASMTTSHPTLRSTSAMSGTSRICGQLVIVLVPSVSSAAAISLSTLFLAPTTSTAPTSRAPPCTAKCSLILANNAFRTHPANLGVRSSPWPFGSTAYTPRSAMTVLPHSATVLVSPRQTHASVPTPRRRKPTPPSGSPSKWGSSPRRSPPCSVSYRTTSSM